MGKVLMTPAGGGVSSDDVTASKAEVLSGYTALTKDSDDEPASGTMANQGAVSQALNCGGSYTIPAGYHNGSGKVTANSLASQTDATAAAGQILSGYTAWVKGNKVTGTMANQGAVSQALNCGGSYTIPAGYHNGSGKVTANSLSSQTDATAAAGQILSGYTAWVKGSKITGSMANKGALNWSGSNTTYSVPAGYYSGGTLDSRPSYNAGVSAGKTAIDGSGQSSAYNGTANNVKTNAPNHKLTGITGSGHIIAVIILDGRVWGKSPSRTFTVTNGSPQIVVNHVWDNYGNRNNAARELAIWFVKVKVSNASNAQAYFTIGHEYNPDFLVHIGFFKD